MSVWDNYRDRMERVGQTKHDMWIKSSQENIRRRLVDSPNCRQVTVDGEEQTLAITKHAQDGYKRVAAMPGERLKHGGLVDWKGTKWLITEVDPDDVIYQRGIMRRCNHILRWISSKTGELYEKWCVVEDGTKYLIGERTREVLTIGDGRMAVTIAKDPETVELCRGLRFLIDDEDSEFVTAYQITKSNKLFNVYDGEGVFRFILNEVQLTDRDDVERRIADYKDRKGDGSVAGLIPAMRDYYADATTGDAPGEQTNMYDGSGTQPVEEQGGWI